MIQHQEGNSRVKSKMCGGAFKHHLGMQRGLWKVLASLQSPDLPLAISFDFGQFI